MLSRTDCMVEPAYKHTDSVSVLLKEVAFCYKTLYLCKALAE